MQAVLLLVIAGSAVWVGLDASKRDWTDNSFARNTASWIVGCLLLWPVVFPLYALVARKKAPLLNRAPAAPEPQEAPAPAAAAEPQPAMPLAVPPSEAFGPSIDELPEPVAEIEPDPVIEIEPDPVIEVEREPVVAFEAPEPVVEIEPDPVIEVEREPVVAFEAPEPVVEIDPDPVTEIEQPPAAGVDWAALAAADQEVAPVGEVPVDDQPLEVHLPEEAPSALSLDAFKDIKPVAFGGFAAAEDEEPPGDTDPEPVVEIEPEPVVALETSEPVIEIDPEPVTAEPEPDPEPKPKRGSKFNPELKLPSFGRKKKAAAVAATAAPAAPEPDAQPQQDAKPKRRRGLKLPNPQLKLPALSLGKKQKPSKDTAPADTPASLAGTAKGKSKGFLSLPPQLQGPLNDVERKIVLGAAVAVLAAGAFGYTSAPQEEPVAAPAPPPAAPATAP